MATFDVTPLFTTVPVQYTIDVILRYMYLQNRISTTIKLADLKKLLIYLKRYDPTSFLTVLYMNKLMGVQWVPLSMMSCVCACAYVRVYLTLCVKTRYLKKCNGD